MKLGLVVPACGPETKEAKERFLDLLSCYRGQTVYPFELFLEEGQEGGKDFSNARAKNAGIRRALESGCTVIAAADIDTPIPPGLTDFTVENTARGTHLWVLRHDLGPTDPFDAYDFARWSKIPPHGATPKNPHGYCWGSYNAMTSEDWVKVGGFDERCFGWGGEDDLLHLRAKEAGMKKLIAADWPLAHVHHPPRVYFRENNRGADNLRQFRVGRQPNFLLPRKPLVSGAHTTILLTNGKRPELLRRVVESFTPFVGPIEVITHGKDILGEWPAVRAKVFDHVTTEFTVFLEDDFVLSPVPKPEELQQLKALLGEIPEALAVGFRVWPSPRRVSPCSGIEYREPVFTGTNAAPGEYANYAMSHWPPFSFNPGIFRTDHLLSCVTAANGVERAAGEVARSLGLRYLTVANNLVHHLGTVSVDKKGFTWPLFTGAAKLDAEWNGGNVPS